MTLQRWEPTALEMMLAMNAVLTDVPVHTEALFVHGAPARDDDLDRILLRVAADAHLESKKLAGGEQPKIVLNGLSAEECKEKNLAYVGHEVWTKHLIEYGVQPNDILLIPPSSHTAAESRNLLLLVEKRKWSRITICSYPYHQLRCFLTIIALMDEVGIRPLVYNRTFHAIDWRAILRKPVLGGSTVLGGGDIVGRLPRHIEEEYERIVAYAQDPTLTGRQYTRHATIPEMLEHLKSRVPLIEAQDLLFEGKTPWEDWNAVK